MIKRVISASKWLILEVNKLPKMRIFLSILGICLFFFVSLAAVYLLFSGMISGTNLTVIVVSFAVLGLIISILPEVQEFSIAGNSVKLKGLKNEAEKIIRSLNKTRTESYKHLFSQLEEYKPDIRLHDICAKDGREERFLSLYNEVKSFDGLDDLKEKIISTAGKILESQQDIINNCFKLMSNQAQSLDAINPNTVLQQFKTIKSQNKKSSYAATLT
jgi:hypothetical protein